MTRRSSKVTPLPGVVPLGTGAQAMVEHAVASFHNFVSSHGNPAGFAIVIIGENGDTLTDWRTEDELWPVQFLAYAGTCLQAEAMETSVAEA